MGDGLLWPRLHLNIKSLKRNRKSPRTLGVLVLADSHRVPDGEKSKMIINARLARAEKIGLVRNSSWVQRPARPGAHISIFAGFTTGGA
jgi:hypothetical protein